MFRSKFHYLVNPCRNTQGWPSVKVIIRAQQTKEFPISNSSSLERRRAKFNIIAFADNSKLRKSVQNPKSVQR